MIDSTSPDIGFQFEHHPLIAILSPLPDMEHLQDDQMERTIRSISTTLQTQKPKGLVIDLSNLKYCNSVFISFLLRCRLAARKLGLEMALSSPSEPVQKLLKMLDLDSIWPIYENREIAIEHMQKSKQSPVHRLDESK